MKLLLKLEINRIIGKIVTHRILSAVTVKSGFVCRCGLLHQRSGLAVRAVGRHVPRIYHTHYATFLT